MRRGPASKRTQSAAAQAERDIRGILENLVSRNQRIVKSLATKPRPSAAELWILADAAAVIKLAGSLLEHLDADAKQTRMDADGQFGGGR